MPKKSVVLEDSFRRHLVEALEHFTSAQWLGEHSPLASPYFLGEYLLALPKHEAERAAGRGKALQRLLRRTAEVLAAQADEGPQLARLLELTYFQPQPEQAILDALNISRAAYFRHRKEKAIPLFEQVLVALHHPALRLEAQAPPPQLVGRDDLVPACLTALQRRETVGLSGPGGIGKTALAAQIARLWAPRPTFWYTFHLGLNDRLQHLLFALAYFLQQHGAPDLWLQLVADEGKIDMQLVPGLLRHDLQKLADSPPILCFDEIDLLNAAGEAHAQISNFLASLNAEAALLLVGRHVSLATTTTYALAELSLAATRDLLFGEQITLAHAELARLHEFTRGNPRLLLLFATLHHKGEPLPEVLAQMAAAPSLEGLLNRVWQRLAEPEQFLLAELAVYRSPAPHAAWPEQQGFLAQLIALHLVQDDGRGGVLLLPAYRNIIYTSRPPEERSQLHLIAAGVRAGLAERTAAAYHCVQAQRPDLAVNLWYPHRQAEINQGQAETALALFNQVARDQLSNTAPAALALIRAELAVLRGEYAPARNELRTTAWSHDVFAARRSRLQGDIAEVTGELDTARLAYMEGLGTVDNLRSKEAIRFHLDLGWVDRRQTNFSRAWQETQLAEYETEDLRGDILRDQGRFEEAQAHYARAIALAGEAGNLHGQANTHNALAALLAQQGRFEAAGEHWETAYRCFKQIGKLVSLPSVRVNQATGYLLAGEPVKAIVCAEEALTEFEIFAQPYGVAVAANTLAEAHLALRSLDAAEQYIARVLATEEAVVIVDALRIHAEIMLERQQPAAALPLCMQAIQAAEEQNDRYIEGYARRLLGRVHHALANGAGARDALQAALAIFMEMGLDNEAEQTRKLLAAFLPPA
jgi:tetratricopeptide (TPR) repeat protein